MAGTAVGRVHLTATPLLPEVMPQLVMAVQCLVSGTSPHFVPWSPCSVVIQDACIVLRCFKNSCRWQKFWLKETSGKSDTPSSPHSMESAVTLTESSVSGGSLDVGLRPLRTIRKEAPIGSVDLEGFLLKAVEHTILGSLKADNLDYVSNSQSKKVIGLLGGT